MIDFYKKISQYSEKVIFPIVGFCFGCFISLGDIFLKNKNIEALISEQPLTIIVFLFSLLIVIVYFIVYLIYLKQVNDNNYPVQFNQLMNKHTIPLLVDLNKGMLSWGANKCFFSVRHLVEGLPSENISIEMYDDDKYQMEQWKHCVDDRNVLDQYNSYYESENFQKVINRGDNLPRFMLTDYIKNHNKDKETIALCLKRCEWSQCSFVWNYYKQHKDVLKEDTHNAFNFKGQLSPNSLSLHLIIETKDRKVVLASVGSKKFNDYPDTIAATLGEQIELTDFLSQNSFNDNFLDIWVKRACIEEFCLNDFQYKLMFDKESIRVLGITFEADIYNFALATTIKLNVKFSEFYSVIKTSINQLEANDFYALDITRIPEFILNNGDFSNISANIKKHPSTDYRLLLLYLHHYGLRHGCQNVVRCYKKCK